MQPPSFCPAPVKEEHWSHNFLHPVFSKVPKPEAKVDLETRRARYILVSLFFSLDLSQDQPKPITSFSTMSHTYTPLANALQIIFLPITCNLKNVLSAALFLFVHTCVL